MFKVHHITLEDIRVLDSIWLRSITLTTVTGIVLCDPLLNSWTYYYSLSLTFFPISSSGDKILLWGMIRYYETKVAILSYKLPSNILMPCLTVWMHVKPTHACCCEVRVCLISFPIHKTFKFMVSRIRHVNQQFDLEFQIIPSVFLNIEHHYGTRYEIWLNSLNHYSSFIVPSILASYLGT